MSKPILYSDFDGVIFDTIDVAYRMMKEKKIDIHDTKARNEFFQYILNYLELYMNATIIKDAANKLISFKKSDIFSDVIILTKLSGNYEEEGIKRNFLNEILPCIRVITLQFDLRKSSVVNPVGNILVDDEEKNCLQWNIDGGEAILFNKKILDLENNIINDLSDLTNTKGVKKLIRKY